MDSGVFSAWGRGETLDIKEYCAFIKRNEPLLSCYATMDVIPGEFGRKRTSDEVEKSAQGSYKNQQKMKDKGLKPIPIFHQGEAFRWLEKYVADGEPYVGISTAKDLRNTEQRKWLDEVFTAITDKSGRPYIHTHGFGITNIPLLLRYPWYTADSTTWSLAAGFGLVYVPQMTDGQPDFSHLPTRVIMSGRTQSSWSSRARQFEAMPVQDQEWVLSWLKWCGVTLEEAVYVSPKRRLACLKYFVGFSRSYKLGPFGHRHKPGWFESSDYLIGLPPEPLPAWSNMRVIFATMLYNGQFSRLMEQAEARDRLVSYWEIKGKNEEALEKYITTGIVDADYKPRRPPNNWNDNYTSTRRMQLLARIAEYGQE